MKHDDHHDQNSGGPGANGVCERVLELIPTFVDSEASVSLASAVRKHLIECADCRVVAQEEKSLRQWFEPIAGEAGRADLVVPEGFAARVTAMAFSRGEGSEPEFTADGGATGHTSGQMPGLRSESQERRGPRLVRSPNVVSATSGPADRERHSIGFLVSLTAVAAALMVTLTLMLAQDGRQDVGAVPLNADSPLDETLRELEALNELEIQALENEAAGQENPAQADPAVVREADTESDPSTEGEDVTRSQGDER